MTVLRIAFREVSSDGPGPMRIILLTDGTDVRTWYSDSMFAGRSDRDEDLESITESFRGKIKNCGDSELLDCVTANLMMANDEPVEYKTWDEAVAAVEEVVNDATP